MKTNFYTVIAPGKKPGQNPIEPNVVELDWMFAEKETGDLIDTVNIVDKQLKSLEKWVDAARDVLKLRLPKPIVSGTETITRGKQFEAHYIKSSRSDIDRTAVKAEMGETWYNAHCKQADIFTLKITALSNTEP